MTVRDHVRSRSRSRSQPSGPRRVRTSVNVMSDIHCQPARTPREHAAASPVDSFERFDDGGLHGIGEVSEGVGARQAAELAPLVVSGHSVIAALLDQLGGQVQTETCIRNTQATLVSRGTVRVASSQHIEGMDRVRLLQETQSLVGLHKHIRLYTSIASSTRILDCTHWLEAVESYTDFENSSPFSNGSSPPSKVTNVQQNPGCLLIMFCRCPAGLHPLSYLSGPS